MQIQMGNCTQTTEKRGGGGGGQKVALCFLISYEHRLTHEALWKEWIAPNQDIITIYFHYKDAKQLEISGSQWVRAHSLPKEAISPTSYYHIVPALISILAYAYHHDNKNRWFCLLTESCVPIISPAKFRELFMTYGYQSLMKWQASYWNVYLHQRANLRLLPSRFHLANDPWIVLTRTGVEATMNFMLQKNEIYQTICAGGLANESLFAIVMEHYGLLSPPPPSPPPPSPPSSPSPSYVRNEITTLSDWTRRSSPTSPYLFVEDSEENYQWITRNRDAHPFAIFLRKVSPEFPDSRLRELWDVPLS